MMKVDAVNKMTHTSAEGCDCTHCRVQRAGLGPGPYTPDEYKLIAPPVLGLDPAGVDIASDPAVQRAGQDAGRAQGEYESAHDRWIAAVAAAQTATLTAQSAEVRIGIYSGALYPADAGTKIDRGRELDVAANELRAERDRAHKRWRAALAVQDDAARRARWRAEAE